jgi:diadenosine tetraphosphate (Ap4A) HIT family hydrolase
MDQRGKDGHVSIELLRESVIRHGRFWTVAVNRNQNLLGKVMLVARREVHAVTDLDRDEWTDLHQEIRQTCAALDSLFQPDQYNHAFLMNLDAQVHLHVVPRYRGVRQWDGKTFDDPHPGALFGTEQRVLEGDELARLAAAIRGRLPDGTSGAN